MAYTDKEAIHFPFILFKIQGHAFCIDSRYVSSILELPEYQSLPNTPPYITGIFAHRDSHVTMFDLRRALELPTLQDEYDAFTQMLDQRKQDHLNWISTLENCLASGMDFPLATDPHQCALGRWYDHFHTDSQELSRHLAQMVEPHARLHRSALEATACAQQGDTQQLNAVLQDAKHACVPKVLDVLDSAKEIFRTRIYHEMVLLLSGKRGLGLVVDEVLCVEHLEEQKTDDGFKDWSFSPLLSRVMSSPTCGNLVLEINAPEILRMGDRLPPSGIDGELPPQNESLAYPLP